ncbi:phosducin-like protein 2 [Loxodonta africana]|uniref:phosducin-like protein 2 n=1 Tax=Loxodonta africana TaxID=9785 RepID=UPI0030CCB476
MSRTILVRIQKELRRGVTPEIAQMVRSGSREVAAAELGDQHETALEPTNRDPNEDTEWNEILRDFGILPPKEEPEDEIEEMVLRLQKEAMVKPYERMNLAQLKEAEDEFDDEDMRAIEIYREKRLQEWKALKKKQKFGELREISGNQYVKEVTNAEEDVWVIVHLYRSSITMCLLVNQHLSLLARKFPETKFVKAIVNSCIQHYHDNCLPTIFVYKNGQIEGKFIGVIECGGINLKLEELEWKLAEVGAIQTDLEENPKKGIVDVMVSSIRNTSIYNDSNNSNSNNDDTK